MTLLAVPLAILLTYTLGEGKQPTSDDMAQAHLRFQRATELYEEKNVAGALAEFRRAYLIAPNFKLLFNIGQLCYLMENHPGAHDALSRYLADGGNQISTARRKAVQRDLARLQARLGKVRIVADRPGAEVTIDDVPIGKTPLEEPVVVSVGRPEIRLTLSGYLPASRSVDVASMDTVLVELQLRPLPGTLVAAAPPPLSAAPAAAVGLDPSWPHALTAPWFITVVLALAAGTTGALALWSSSDLKKRRAQIPIDMDDLASRSTRTKRLALVTDFLFGASASAVVIASYLTVSLPAHSRSAMTLFPAGLSLTRLF